MKTIHGECAELVRDDREWRLGCLRRCGRPSVGVRLIRAESGTPLRDLGRQAVVEGPYCDEHGGADRARSRALRAWSYAAPDSAGDEGDVVEAGCAALGTPHAYVVIRREQPQTQPARWEAEVDPADLDLARQHAGTLRAVGLLGWPGSGRGGLPDDPAVMRLTRLVGGLDRVATAEHVALRLGIRVTVIERPAQTAERARPWIAAVGLGSMLRVVSSHETEAEAVEAATAAWRSGVVARVSEIREMRGGTLGWGVPVTPRAEPIVVRPAPGECSWDAATRIPRDAPAGVAHISGARPDGSAA